MRVEAAAGKAGVPVIWKPFLLGPIFQAQGYESSPFFAFPVKGQYMWRDLERLCAKYHLDWKQPSSFPRTSIRSEEHTSELQSLMRISYAVFCLKKTKQTNIKTDNKNNK